jgi:hypothetical protein
VSLGVGFSSRILCLILAALALITRASAVVAEQAVLQTAYLRNMDLRFDSRGPDGGAEAGVDTTARAVAEQIRQNSRI